MDDANTNNNVMRDKKMIEILDINYNSEKDKITINHGVYKATVLVDHYIKEHEELINKIFPGVSVNNILRTPEKIYHNHDNIECNFKTITAKIIINAINRERNND